MDDDMRHRLHLHFDRGFRELQLTDIRNSEERDIRMGTFVQCAAFLDALALAYSAGLELPKVKGMSGDAVRWKRFVEAYFPAEYAPVAVAYQGFRCLLLHNFSADATLAFTHDEPEKHLTRRLDARVLLDRGSFVAAVTDAFDAFQRDVFEDDALAERVLVWLDKHPPLGFWVPKELRITPARLLGAQSATASPLASFSTSPAASVSPPLLPGFERSRGRPNKKRKKRRH